MLPFIFVIVDEKKAMWYKQHISPGTNSDLNEVFVPLFGALRSTLLNYIVFFSVKLKVLNK